MKAIIEMPDQLHPDSALLVANIAKALAEKMVKSQEKYGWTNEWTSSDWMDDCRRQLLEHLAKGDPRDVMVYCAFLWHHHEKTTLYIPNS